MNKHPLLYSFLFIGLILFVFFAIFLGFFFIQSGEKSFFLPIGDVAVVEIEGPIFDSKDVLKDLERYRKNKSLKAVVLRIDSPGGAVAPSQEIFEEVKKLRNEKKVVVVSMGTVAASGGYYIAIAADKIFASKGTITGSIGVIMENFGVQELLEKIHLKNRIIKSGEYKDVGSPFREMEPDERAYLQTILDNMYVQFKTAVSEQRKIPMEEMDKIANGRIYTGEQALQAGLIDALGTLYDALDSAKKLAGLPEDAVVIWPKKDTFSLIHLLGSESRFHLMEDLLKQWGNTFQFPLGYYYLKTF